MATYVYSLFAPVHFPVDLLSFRDIASMSIEVPFAHLLSDLK